jgi:hypothetical protein
VSALPAEVVAALQTLVTYFAPVVAPVVAEHLRARAYDVAPGSIPVLYSSRAPRPAPPRGGTRSDHGARRWLRENYPALRQYGAVRTGGRSGRGVEVTISADGLRRYEDAERARAATVEAATTMTAATDAAIDAWISGAGFRATRTPRGKGAR